MPVFNVNNTEWQTGQGSLFLGQEPALYDSINRRHPDIFSIYKLQKSIDWAEDEINLEQSRMDLLVCPKSTYDIMLENIAFQWEADSVAARSIASLFAPFITNSELWTALVKNTEIENTHALTYSEIVRQCVPDPQEVFKRVMYNETVLNRLDVFAEVFEELKIAGAKYTLGLVENNQELYNVVFLAFIALYILERLQFMVSFAATFAIVEQGYFQGIGKLVQKIMQDELGCHAELDRLVLRVELKTERGQIAMRMLYDRIVSLINRAIEREREFARHLFSNGRSIVGLNYNLVDEWILYNASIMVESFMPDTYRIPRLQSPLKYMDNWIDLDKFQNAQQEGDGNNYALNVVINDLEEDMILDY